MLRNLATQGVVPTEDQHHLRLVANAVSGVPELLSQDLPLTKVTR